jgi:GNAT superfamily N-acetyltransferase
MIPLDAAGMQSHPLGLAMVHAWVSGHGFFHKEPVAYTGITGFKEYEGKKLAIVGGVITLPAARGKKLGHMTVGGLLEIAASDDSTAQYGHEGFIAKCNENSEGLFLNHGFEVIALEEGKTVMMKEI